MNVDREMVGQLSDAAVDDPGKAEGMLREHPELLHARYIHDETPLHFLAIEGYVEGVRVLGRLGFDVNAVNEFGDTALVDVALLGNDSVAEALLELGADPNATSDTRDNVLHAAVASGNPRLVELLLAAGANPSASAEAGDPVFALLPEDREKHDAVLRVLRGHGIVPGEA